MKRIFTPTKKRKILMMGDDPVTARLYEAKLQSCGFIAESVDEASKVLSKLREEEVSLVLIDVLLPETDGLELVKQIRAEREATALPLIVCVNAYLGKVKREVLAAGATRCIPKAETTADAMAELVGEVLGQTQTQGTRMPQASLESESLDELEAILRDRASQAHAELAAAYQSLTRTEDLEARKGTLAEMRQPLHSLLGAVHFRGFEKVARMSSAMEGLCTELHWNPQNMTPSVVRTLGQSIDTLSHLIATTAADHLEVARSPKVLVVDDEAISRGAICSALKKTNLTPVSLDDPLAAQGLLSEESFDLIFLDIEMPGLSGLELCAKIREMSTNRTTPVVFVTAHSDFGTRARSALSGGKDFIAKPFLSVELAVKALTWLFPVTVSPVWMAPSAPALRVRDEETRSRVALAVE